MSAAENAASAERWIGRMKDMACRLVSIADEMPLQPQQRAFIARLTELQFAQIATIEAAIADGMSVRSAAEVTRAVAGAATGLELVERHSAAVPSTAVEQLVRVFGASVLNAITTVSDVDGASAPVVVEPTHSDHQTRQ